jgi:uncharacterized protein (DUF58 family)
MPRPQRGRLVTPSTSAPPSPPWVTVPGIAFQGCGTFLLPWVVGFVAALFFEVSEVVETRTAMTTLAVVVLFPVLLVQSLGLILKTRRDLAFWRSRGQLGLLRLLDVVHDHLRVVTLRGYTLLFLGCALVVAALAAQWAQFGLMATLALLIFYAVTGWTVFVSTFLVRRFDRQGRNQARLTRQVMPAVVVAGEAVEEVFRFDKVPVPWGYLLVVEDPNPVRLRTESRYVVGAEARGHTEARGRLRASPRGHYRLGPARLWYQDVLGITRISVSMPLDAELKVLPRMKPVQITEAPRSHQQSPDILVRPHRQPTDDWFRFREYTAGDDIRRIHWGLSMKAGAMFVRQPETREIKTEQVVLVLDTYVPKGRGPDAALGGDEIMDGLVECWLGIAKRLVEHGDRVTLVAALPPHLPGHGAAASGNVAVESLVVRPGEHSKQLDMGARATWQSQHDLGPILDEVGPGTHGIVVSGRFVPPPKLEVGQSITWLLLDPAQALGPQDPHWITQITGRDPLSILSWVFRLPHTAGAEENAIWPRIRDTVAAMRLWNARKSLRTDAHQRAGAIQKALAQRGDRVYRIDRTPTHIRLSSA